MKVIITVLIFPMQNWNNRTTVNLLPQGHTATPLAEQKAATVLPESCLHPVIRDPFCPGTPFLPTKLFEMAS